VPPQELARAVGTGRRARDDRLGTEVTADVLRERRGARIAPVHVLLERLAGDDLQVGIEAALPAPDLAERAGRRLGDDLHRLVHGQPGEAVRPLERHHLVEDDAEGVDVGPHVHASRLAARLLRAHVRRRAAHDADAGQRRTGVLLDVGEARQREIEHLEVRKLRGRPRLGRDDDVRRLQVTVDDAPLVRVVHGGTDRLEEPQPQHHLLVGKGVGAAGEPAVERLAPHELHREPAVPVLGPARLVDRGDVRVLEAAERFDLALEHARLQLAEVTRLAPHLDGDAAARMPLLRLPDDTHATLTQQSDDAIRADRRRHRPPRRGWHRALFAEGPSGVVGIHPSSSLAA
jgi:hypothetical protein